jgi:Transglutaminase-like superfamily
MRADRPRLTSWPAKAVLCVRIWTFVSILPLLLRLCSLPRLLQLCTAGTRGSPADTELVVTCTDLALGRRIWAHGGPCLIRSLTLYRFLGGDAANIEICFGVRYADGASPDGRVARLLGHAWLVRDGQPYLERDGHQTRRFRVVYRHPITRKTIDSCPTATASRSS